MMEAGSDRSGQNSLEASLLLFLSHLAASLPLHLSTSIYYHFTVTSCRSLWLWPIFWAETPELSLSMKAAWAAQEKKLFVTSHLNTFLSLVSAISVLFLFIATSCFKRQRQHVIKTRLNQKAVPMEKLSPVATVRYSHSPEQKNYSRSFWAVGTCKLHIERPWSRTHNLLAALSCSRSCIFKQNKFNCNYWQWTNLVQTEWLEAQSECSFRIIAGSALLCISLRFCVSPVSSSALPLFIPLLPVPCCALVIKADSTRRHVT